MESSAAMILGFAVNSTPPGEILSSGCWLLPVSVEGEDGLKKLLSLRVDDKVTIGGVLNSLMEIVASVNELRGRNWTDHCLFWVEKNIWLLNGRLALNDCGLQSNSTLRFIQTRSPILLQLPDLQTRKIYVNFSKTVFSLVSHICQEIGIRHSEELSLARAFPSSLVSKTRVSRVYFPRRAYSSTRDIHETLSKTMTKPRRRNQHSSVVTMKGSSEYCIAQVSTRQASNDKPSSSPDPPNSLFVKDDKENFQLRNKCLSVPMSPAGTLRRGDYLNTIDNVTNRALHKPMSNSSLLEEIFSEEELSESQPISCEDGFGRYLVPPMISSSMKARWNALWLDSSKSLLEQGIEPHLLEGLIPFLLLRFKFHTFYDLNEEYDAIRINQLFHQARWSILSEELAVTEEECIWFAALQFHLSILSSLMEESVDGVIQNIKEVPPEEEVDEMLDALSTLLECGEEVDSNMSQYYQLYETLADWVKCYKTGKFTLHSYKKYWLVLKNDEIHCYKSVETTDVNTCSIPMECWPLKNCLVQNETPLNSKQFIIHVYFPNGTPLPDVKLRFSNDQVGMKWLSACQRAAFRNTSTFTISSPLHSPKLAVSDKSRQKRRASQLQRDISKYLSGIEWTDFIPPKYFKRLRKKTLQNKVLQAYSNVQMRSRLALKLEYIKAWQKLPGFGVAYFIVRLRQEKEDHLLGITSSRIILMDHGTNVMRKSWLLSELKTWHVNWQLEEVVMLFHREKITFTPLYCSCKVIHEFIGGYICLALRTPEKNRNLDESVFLKFTSDMQTRG